VRRCINHSFLFRFKEAPKSISGLLQITTTTNYKREEVCLQAAVVNVEQHLLRIRLILFQIDDDLSQHCEKELWDEAKI